MIKILLNNNSVIFLCVQRAARQTSQHLGQVAVTMSSKGLEGERRKRGFSQDRVVSVRGSVGSQVGRSHQYVYTISMQLFRTGQVARLRSMTDG